MKKIHIESHRNKRWGKKNRIDPRQIWSKFDPRHLSKPRFVRELSEGEVGAVLQRCPWEEVECHYRRRYYPTGGGCRYRLTAHVQGKPSPDDVFTSLFSRKQAGGLCRYKSVRGSPWRHGSVVHLLLGLPFEPRPRQPPPPEYSHSLYRVA